MATQLARAILQTLHYADIFDYPLTDDELERYLIGARASRPEIKDALCTLIHLDCAVAADGPFLTLAHRRPIASERLRLQEQARAQLARARFYGRLLGYFPFVRMVALTGALAMQNARDGDIDLLIVSAPGRLWLVRAAAVALVRLARLRGDYLCPNLLLTENRLLVTERNLYSAHEIVQMIPLYGLSVYLRLCHVNSWVTRYLPNADPAGRADSERAGSRTGALCKRIAEFVLGGHLGQSIERWEFQRKSAKLAAQVPIDADGVEFSSEACRGFLSGHGRKVLFEFSVRVQAMDQLYEQAVRVEA